MATEINPEIRISQHSLNTDDYTVNFSWYQSGKSKLIILALGMGSPFEDKLPFIREFTQYYDVIVFDYEWQNRLPISKKISMITTPMKSLFEHNYKEVQTIVNFARETNQYNSIIGHGECYSVFMFIKAQANSPAKLFDKLVLDSGILSVKNSIKALINNPALYCNPLDGESSKIVKALMGNRFFLGLIDFCLNDRSIRNDLNKINIPVLFIRGSKDSLVSKADFTEIWNLVEAPKAAFITPYHHSNSFKLKNARREYIYIENLFIENSFNEFIKEVIKFNK